MKGNLIVIEGTDCSGKETQTQKLMKRLRKQDIQIEMFSFPNYSSPTGKIIGGPYLSKKTYVKAGLKKQHPMLIQKYHLFTMLLIDYIILIK